MPARHAPRAFALDERSLARAAHRARRRRGRRDGRRRRRARRGARSRPAQPRRAPIRNSRLPSRPRIGEGIEADDLEAERGRRKRRCPRRRGAAPPRRARRPSAHAPARPRTAASPGRRASRRAASSGTTGGSTSFSEMKLTSATRSSIGSGTSIAVEAAGIRRFEAHDPRVARQASDGAGRGRRRPRTPARRRG